MQAGEVESPRKRVSVTRIEPSSGWVDIRFQEIWECRELLYFLVWRDIKVRYKQTVLGTAWAILQPFLTMGIFSSKPNHRGVSYYGENHIHLRYVLV